MILLNSSFLKVSFGISVGKCRLLQRVTNKCRAGEERGSAGAEKIAAWVRRQACLVQRWHIYLCLRACTPQPQ